MRGLKVQFGFVCQSDDGPRGSYRGWLLIGCLAIAAATVWLLPMKMQTSQPAAQVVPAPSPSLSPSPIALHVTGATGPICILTTGKPKTPVELVKVP